MDDKRADGPPRILLVDIETAPLEAYVWGLWDNNVPLNMISKDWHLMSWAAKWLGDPPSKIMYQDQRHSKDLKDDKKILLGIWKLLDEADVTITQNGKVFDHKKLNARFIIQGYGPHSPVRYIDTLSMAKKHFGFTSNKLEYMTDKLCTKYKKLKHGRFPGFEMWKECLKGNIEAWNEMEKYNKYDVLSLEELYNKLQPWGSGVKFSSFREEITDICNCGNSHLTRRGFEFTNTGKFQRYQCMGCRAWSTAKNNLLSKDKRKSLKK